MDSFLSIRELKQLNLKSFGENIRISRKASFYKTEGISIGDNVRIDDFCILSGEISIGNYIHIAAYTALYGGEKGIEIKDYSNISSKVSVYSISDDYSGNSLTNPMIPEKYKLLQSEKVIIEKHVIIGSGCVILPGSILREGSSFGALTLVNRSSEPWSINIGIPYRKIKDRSRHLLELEKQFVQEVNKNE